MRAKVATAVAAFLLVVAPSVAGASRSGLTGVVMRGPIVPVCTAEQSCDAPAAGTLLTFSRKGSVAGRVRTRDDGSYRIALPPGRYAVATMPRRSIIPATVTVVAGRFRTIGFSIDTGIR